MLKTTELRLNLPAGWDFEKVFGERPQPTMPPSERCADNGDVQLATERRPAPVVSPTSNTVILPKTATDAELKMMIGSIMLLLSLILMWVRRRPLFGS